MGNVSDLEKTVDRCYSPRRLRNHSALTADGWTDLKQKRGGDFWIAHVIIRTVNFTKSCGVSKPTVNCLLADARV